MKILAIESSCDETAAAVIDDGLILSDPIASQIQLHAEYGGVVPELAAREHLKNLLPVARQALDRAGKRISDMDLIAATQGPGLPPALLVGFHSFQTLAFALDKPFIGVNHHEAHLYSPWIDPQTKRLNQNSFQPNISLIVSGGHTMLVKVDSPLNHHVIGATIDDAAGECFDKTAKLLGLPYPGGPVLDQLASKGNPKAYVFPRPMLKDPGFDFSFSGLKTSVRYFIQKHPALVEDHRHLQDLCASIQAAIVDVLVKKTIRAALQSEVAMITASGGVSCNRGLRNGLQEACDANGLSLRIAQGRYCTDNAAMVGMLAAWKIDSGASLQHIEEGIRPGWRLETDANE
ncbi:tRNA (adenosine(37)-N6)-threonylcarbamoyltransferase complex transferase subunit TsaD [Verrucomicrobia bacterium]|nr:tRNA (adenosine(37)-N6)-threonylcarbamoyltransferase complex transferase subunit TsaD [Verrucomicrobiota bacterium]